MLKCLSSSCSSLLENVVLGLGNIAGDKLQWRNYLLMSQVDQDLVALYYRLDKSTDVELVKTLAWALSNLMRGCPAPPLCHVSVVLPVFCDLLQCSNEAFLSKALWGLTNIAKGGLDRGLLVIEAGCLPKAVECVAYGNRMVHLPAVNLVGEISMGDFLQIEGLFELNILDKLSYIIMSRDSEVRRQIFWVLSNITADSAEHSCKVLNSQIIYLALKGLTDTNLEVRREASYIFRNLAYEASVEQALKLVAIGVVPLLKAALDYEEDTRCILNLLDVIRVLLYYGEEDAGSLDNPISQLFCKLRIDEVFDQLVVHSNVCVVESVQLLMARYFELSEDDMDLTNAPEEFQFS